MQKSRPLFVEHLEDRTTPAAGVTWPDGMHLTLSFAPDGTAVDGYRSRLFAALDAVAPRDTWQREVVRAFQTWTQYTNLSVGVVPDGGQPLGCTGAVQADPRFGDIRVAAVPLPAGTLATNTPFQWSGTTWSGDVLLNSNYLFSVDKRPTTNDLFTVMLNEAGNVFGVLDSTTDTTSAVYYQYDGPTNGISSVDRASIQSLYGARSPDEFDAARSNSGISHASNLGSSPAKLNKEGDITTMGDVDFYKFTLPLETPVAAFTVRLTTSGLSSLVASLEVYNKSGRLVGAAVAYDPLRGDLTVRVAKPALASTYYLRVTNNISSVFGVGSYRVSVVYTYPDGTTSVLASPNATPVSDKHNNDVITSATNLNPRKYVIDDRFDFTFRGVVCDTTDMDFYEVPSPTGEAGAQKLNVLVWSLDGRLAPVLEVFDASYCPVAARLLANEDGTYSLEIPNTTPGAVNYIKVAAMYPAGGRATGSYFLAVDFSTQPLAVFDSYASGTLTSSAPAQFSTLTVGQNSLLEFVLSADAGAGGEWTQVAMEIIDEAGNVVFGLAAYSGQPASTGHVYLRAGTYTVRFSAAAPAGSALGPVSYSLYGRLISDPIGPQTTSSTTTTTTTTTTTWTSTETSTLTGIYSWWMPYYF